MRLTHTNRRFLSRLLVAALVAGLSGIAARHMISENIVTGPWIWPVALVPGLAMFGIFYAYGMLILEQDDEFIRMLLIRQLVIGTGIALSFAAVWGWLEKFELVEHLHLYYVVVAWLLGFALGGVVNRITHGAWGEMS